jgi:hypothetical protein
MLSVSFSASTFWNGFSAEGQYVMRRSLATVGVWLLAVCVGAAGLRAADDPQTPEAQPAALEHVKPKPITPPKPEEIRAALEKGIAFLLKVQNPDGSWGTAERTKDLNIYAPAPGAHLAFRSGVTALCISALIETGDPKNVDVQQAIDRGEAWMFDQLPHLRRASPDAMYNVWGHAYSIQTLVRMLRRKPDDADRIRKIRELIEMQYDRLERYESVDGGWGYYDFRTRSQKPGSSSISFTTATVLIAFWEAKQAGIEPPPKLVERGLASMKRQLKNDFSYFYGEYLKWQPMHPVNRPGGSLGRSQACNLALRLWGDDRITDEVLEVWLDRLYARNLWLDIGRKRPIPHESWFMVAGYFFYYGHYYAAVCIEQLPEKDRPHFQDHLAAILLPLQEQDGSWWDYPLYNYHQQYGTAFAIMSLQRCLHAVEEAKTQQPAE